MQVKGDVWHLQIRLIVFAQFVIIAVLDMSDPYWPLILASFYPLSVRPLQYWSGAIYVAPLLTMIFTTLVWIKLGERIGYKKMILRAGFALAISQWTLFFLHKPWSIFLIRLLQGALAGFSTAAQAWALRVTPVGVHGQIVGRLQAAVALGSIVGPVCGGILANYFGYLSIFIVSGSLCFLLSVFLANFLSENPINSTVTQSQLARKKLELHENLLVLFVCLTQAARWMSAPFFALYAAQQLHASNISLGFIYAVMALAMTLTTPTLGQFMDRASYAWSKPLLILALLLGGLAQFGFAAITKVYLAVSLSILWGVSLGIISLTLFTLLLKGADDSSRANKIGLGNTALKLGNLLGIIMGTLIQAQGHFTLSFLLIGVFYLILAGLSSYKSF